MAGKIDMSRWSGKKLHLLKEAVAGADMNLKCRNKEHLGCASFVINGKGTPSSCQKPVFHAFFDQKFCQEHIEIVRQQHQDAVRLFGENVAGLVWSIRSGARTTSKVESMLFG